MSMTHPLVKLVVLAVSGVLGGALCNMLMHGPEAVAQSSGTVRAQTFEITDDAGRPRATLSMLEDGPALLLYDAAGQVRAHFLLDDTDDEVALRIYRSDGRMRSSLVEDTLAAAAIVLHESIFEPGHFSFGMLDQDLLQALKLTAEYNVREPLTARIDKLLLSADLGEDSLILRVDTIPSAAWPVYAGSGRYSCSDEEIRSAYSEAARELAELATDFLWALSPEQVVIDFRLDGYKLGRWENGQMTLESSY